MIVKKVFEFPFGISSEILTWEEGSNVVKISGLKEETKPLTDILLGSERLGFAGTKPIYQFLLDNLAKAVPIK